jgi:hypothetical protein
MKVTGNPLHKLEVFCYFLPKVAQLTKTSRPTQQFKLDNLMQKRLSVRQIAVIESAAHPVRHFKTYRHRIFQLDDTEIIISSGIHRHHVAL